MRNELVQMLSLREASARTGLSYDALRKMCIEGQIVHIKVGAKYLVNFGWLVEFLNGAGLKQGD